MNWKRRIYGLPLMGWYRKLRTNQILKVARQTPYGFKLAGFDLYHRPDWEKQERRLVAELLPRCSVLIDCGASHGFYTCWGASLGLAVAAIEAEKNSFSVLARNIAYNGFCNVEAFNLALAKAPGVQPFFGDGDMASLDNKWNGEATSFQQLVATNNLDNLFGDRWANEQILIKIDVEGLEAEVLTGATRLINRPRKPFWLIETFPRPPKSEVFRAVFARLNAAGYSAIVADAPRHRVTETDIERWAADVDEPGRGRSNFLFSAAS